MPPYRKNTTSEVTTARRSRRIRPITNRKNIRPCAMPLAPTCTESRANSHTPMPEAIQINRQREPRRTRIAVQRQRRQQGPSAACSTSGARRFACANGAVRMPIRPLAWRGVMPRSSSRPAEQPRGEPGDPDAGQQRAGAEHGVAHARAVARHGGGARFGEGRGDIHLHDVGGARNGCKGCARCRARNRWGAYVAA